MSESDEESLCLSNTANDACKQSFADLIDILQQFVSKHNLDIGSLLSDNEICSIRFEVPTNLFWNESANDHSSSQLQPINKIQYLSTGLLCDIKTLVYTYAQRLKSEQCDRQQIELQIIKHLLIIIQALLIFSHNPDNIPLLASKDVIQMLILTAKLCLTLFTESNSSQKRNENDTVCLQNLLESDLLLLESICSKSVLAANVCANESMILTLIDIVELQSNVSFRNILRLFAVLSNHRITPFELKRVFRALRQTNEALMLIPLLNTLSITCNNDSNASIAPSQYFYFSNTEDGMFVDTLSWPNSSSGFTFHAWIKLDPQLFASLSNKEFENSKRYQIYSIVTSAETGFEAFVTDTGSLVVSSFTKKDYYAVQLAENLKLVDNQWHLLDFCYSSSSRAVNINPFGIHNSCILTVYIDGVQRAMAQLNVNATQLSFAEGIKVCCVGASYTYNIFLNEIENDSIQLSSKSESHNWARKTLKPVTSLMSKVIFDKEKILNPVHSSLSIVNPSRLFYTKENVDKNMNLQICANGAQDSIWGQPACLNGYLSSVCLFSDGLQHNHIRQLYSIGTSSLTVAINLQANNELYDCFSKLVLYFNAKAFDPKTGICTNLAMSSPTKNIVAKVRGVYLFTSHIKEVINCIGGLHVVYPILEIIAKMGNERIGDKTVYSPISISSHIPAISPNHLIDDWVVLSPRNYRNNELVYNKHPIASFLNLILKLIEDESINYQASYYKEQIMGSNGLPVISLLLQRLPTALINVDFLLTIQQFVEEAATILDSTELLPFIYEHIVFEFRIWSKGDFPTQIGHVQYLFSLIKNERRIFKKKFGIQFFLDTIKHYYVNGATNQLSDNQSDLKSIRHCFHRIIRYYLSKEVNIDEVNALITFIITEKAENLVFEVIDTLLTVLKNKHAKDQLFLLLYEPQQCELLFSVLVDETISNNTKIKILKILILLLKTDKVYEKSKSRLRLRDVGFSCFALFHSINHDSTELLSMLMDMLLLFPSKNDSFVDTDLLKHSFEGIIVLLQMAQYSPISLKINLASKVMKVLMLHLKHYTSIIASLVGWQEAVVSLLVKKPIPRSSPRQSLPNIRSCLITPGRRHSVQGSPNVSNEDHLTDLSPMHFLLRRLSHQISSAGDATISAMSPTPFFFHLKDHITSALSKSQESLHSTESYGGSLITSSTASPVITTPEHDQDVEFFTGGKEEMLLQLVGEMAYLIMFHGIDGSEKDEWLQRGQLMALIDMLSFNNYFYVHSTKVKQFIYKKALNFMLRRLLKGTSNDLDMKNIVRLMQLVFDFVVLEQSSLDFCPLTESMLDQIIELLDLLEVFGEEGWSEMATMGLAILLACCNSKNLTLCARASAKLHGLLQTRIAIDVDECCYLLINLDESLRETLSNNDEDHYSFLIPIFRALLEKITSPFNNNMKKYLSNIPSTINGPSFYEKFQEYALSSEWRRFCDKVVRPHHDKYYSDHVLTLIDAMNTFWNEAHEFAMISRHKREREKGESKMRFQTSILDVVKTKQEEDKVRFNQFLAKLNCSNLSALKRWHLTKLHLYGALNGPWYLKNGFKLNTHWKLGMNENYIRMRPKLVFNNAFDNHTEASWLRDNIGNSANKKTSVCLLKDVIPTLPKIPSKEGEYQAEEEEMLELLAQSFTSVNETNYSVNDSKSKSSKKEETVLISEECELISLMSVIKGKFEASTMHLSFIESLSLKTNNEVDKKYDFKHRLNMLREIYLRRYAMRKSAIEFFLVDQTNFFINFLQPQKALRVFGRLLALRPPNLSPFMREVGFKHPSDILKASGYTERWINREISNFEYLMRLNTIAGRTYNDLGQYPVFPWILADYTSEQLDLNDEKTFRDLSKPIGVVNPENVEKVKSKYEGFLDVSGGSIEKFHYGTHYSNSAGILHYLVRLEPFTKLHIELQSGRFDVADRQFHSIESTWNMLMENPNDVKELIPEFFFMPEFLINMNDFDLGKLQITKEKVNDVKLPRWAHDAFDFIWKHRKALESEYVSNHINEWIDLIFGYKQRGQAAIDSLNVFYYVSYEDAVDLDAIKDKRERHAIEGMISNFGQTPTQLFKDPHPTRNSLSKILRDSESNPLKICNLILSLDSLQTNFVESNDTLVFIGVPALKTTSFNPFITVSINGVISVNSWLPYDKNKLKPNRFTIEKLVNGNPLKLGPLHPSMKLSSKLVAVLPSAKTLIAAGFWDNTIRCYKISVITSYLSSTVTGHADLVTCLAVDVLGKYLISGSKDTTCKVWELDSAENIPSKCIHTLYGHDSEISSVCVCVELDTIVTASINSIINIYTLVEGIYMHTLNTEQPVNCLKINCFGHIISQCGSRNIDVYSINGRHLYSLSNNDKEVSQVNCMETLEDYLIVGEADGYLKVYEVYNMKLINVIPLESSILYITLFNNLSYFSHILVALENSKIAVLTVDAIRKLQTL